mmetsp:Transcript_6634/g.18737  ORF Transcript_6634/g.18737 Transcript_6634/m.18737 type:complete len:240 (+) Transcript_6634:77-796(+)
MRACWVLGVGMLVILLLGNEVHGTGGYAYDGVEGEDEGEDFIEVRGLFSPTPVQSLPPVPQPVQPPEEDPDYCGSTCIALIVVSVFMIFAMVLLVVACRYHHKEKKNFDVIEDDEEVAAMEKHAAMDQKDDDEGGHFVGGGDEQSSGGNFEVEKDRSMPLTENSGDRTETDGGFDSAEQNNVAGDVSVVESGMYNSEVVDQAGAATAMTEATEIIEETEIIEDDDDKTLSLTETLTATG